MTWIDLLTAAIFAVLLFANHLWGFWRGKKHGNLEAKHEFHQTDAARYELATVISHAYNFAERESQYSGRFSPTLTRFIRSLEREEHRK